MKKLFLASHGSLAEGMLTAATMILGEQSDIFAYGLDRWETPKSILREIQKEAANNPDATYIVLCDIKCGSVHNRLLELCSLPNVELITGMNLALVLELALPCEESIEESVESAIALAKKNIVLFNAQSIKQLKKEEDEGELW